MADPKFPTVRKTITLSAVTVKRLELLAQGGWYGSDVAGVAANLVETGLRLARGEGYLTDKQLAKAGALTGQPAGRARRPKAKS